MSSETSTLLEQLDFAKGGGLVPAIVQDATSQVVLMLGYMNAEALEKTLTSGLVTFFSRSKGRLWTKGEESGNRLRLVSLKADCDRDTLLVQAHPTGPVCHTGADTCFFESNSPALGFLPQLEALIAQRQQEQPENSYVAKLYHKGMGKMAQKLGEEAVETVIEALGDDEDKLIDEAADLLFHYLIVLQAKGLDLATIAGRLAERHKAR